MQVKSAWPLPAHNVVANLEIYLIHWPTTPPICISRLSLNAGGIFTGRLPQHMDRGRPDRAGPDRDPRARTGPGPAIPDSSIHPVSTCFSSNWWHLGRHSAHSVEANEFWRSVLVLKIPRRCVSLKSSKMIGF